MFTLYRTAFHAVSLSYTVQCEHIFRRNGEYDFENIQR